MKYEKLLRKNLQTLFDEYVQDTGKKPYVVGRLVAKDIRFYKRIVDGGGFTVATYDRVAANFKAIWPAGLPWPSDIPEPDLEAATLPKET